MITRIIPFQWICAYCAVARPPHTTATILAHSTGDITCCNEECSARFCRQHGLVDSQVQESSQPAWGIRTSERLHIPWTCKDCGADKRPADHPITLFQGDYRFFVCSSRCMQSFIRRHANIRLEGTGEEIRSMIQEIRPRPQPTPAVATPLAELLIAPRVNDIVPLLPIEGSPECIVAITEDQLSVWTRNGELDSRMVIVYILGLAFELHLFKTINSLVVDGRITRSQEASNRHDDSRFSELAQFADLHPGLEEFCTIPCQGHSYLLYLTPEKKLLV